MRLDEDAKEYLWWDAELTFDPTGSTVEIEVDGTRYAMAWQGSPVVVTAGKKWTQTARTTTKFAGSTVTPGAGVVVLTPGTHTLKPVTTPTDGQVVPHSYPSTLISK
jgi:hypothetical protein